MIRDNSRHDVCMKRFEHNIRRILHAKGLSQNQLADLAGMDRGNLSRTVRGQVSPGLGTVQALADAIGCDVSEFFQPIPENEQTKVVR